MGSTVHPSEWKAKESSGTSTQVPMSFLAEVPAVQMLAHSVYSVASFTGCLIEACRHSGKEDQQLADQIHVSPGYFSKFVRRVGEAWARRLVRFMRATNSVAPLQWFAYQMGCELTLLDAQAARIARLEAELMDARRGVQAGRAAA